MAAGFNYPRPVCCWQEERVLRNTAASRNERSTDTNLPLDPGDRVHWSTNRLFHPDGVRQQRQGRGM